MVLNKYFQRPVIYFKDLITALLKVIIYKLYNKSEPKKFKEFKNIIKFKFFAN